MEKLSGLRLDVFDDVGGEVLRGLFPTYDELPELVKNASVLTQEDLSRLPDDLFALVLHDGDVTLRKYACVDAGNTLLNVAYLLAQSHTLPVDAVKVAASNLCTACHWYDIEPPEDLKKLSTGEIPVIGKQQIWKDLDGTLYRNDTQQWDLAKMAEAIGTSDMPLTENPTKTTKKLSVIKKVAEDELLAELFGVKTAEEPDVAEPPTKDNPEALPQAKVMKPHVDVTSKEPPKLVAVKEASFYCMPSIRRYPIDTYAQVKEASAYFQVNHRCMVPEDRREYAEHLYKRAQEIRYPVSESVELYGTQGFSKRAHVQGCIDARKLLLQPHAEQGDTEALKEASAHISRLYDSLMERYGLIDPQVFASTLSEVDKIAGIHMLWDVDVPDPFYSTFAKLAEEAGPKDSILIGNEMMSVRDLQTFARSKPGTIKTRFGCEFAEEFEKDPTGIFDSLPVDQKKVIIRLVNTGTTMSAGASAS
jgi:hypothetical protein